LGVVSASRVGGQMVAAAARGVKSLDSRGVVLGVVGARRAMRGLVVRQVAAGGRVRGPQAAVVAWAAGLPA
jgi:hypothetical protein